MINTTGAKINSNNRTITNKIKQQINPLTFTANNKIDYFQTTQPASSKVNFSGNSFLRMLGFNKTTREKLLGNEKTAAKTLQAMKTESKNAPDVESKRACLKHIPLLTEVINQTDNNLLKLACFKTAKTLYSSYYDASFNDKTNKLIKGTISKKEIAADVLNAQEAKDELDLAKAFLTETKPLERGVKITNPLIPEDASKKHPEFIHIFINMQMSMYKGFAMRSLNLSPNKEAEAKFLLDKVIPHIKNNGEQRSAYNTLKALTKNLEPEKAKPYIDYMEANPIKKSKPSSWFTLDDVRRINQKMIEQGRNK